MPDLSNLTAQDIRETPLHIAKHALDTEIARLRRENLELHKQVVELGRGILKDEILCRRFGIDYMTADGQERAFYAALAIEVYNSKALVK